jgi:hypothetical protein
MTAMILKHKMGWVVFTGLFCLQRIGVAEQYAVAKLSLTIAFRLAMWPIAVIITEVIMVPELAEG